MGTLDRKHPRFFTKSTMTQLFTERGWRVHDIQGINPALHWMDHHPRKAMRFARRLSPDPPSSDDVMFRIAC